MGRIPPEYLPPRGAWQERVYTLPELRGHPARLNSAEELLDRRVAGGRAVRKGWCLAGHFITMDEEGYVTFLSREGQNTRACVALRQATAWREGLEREIVDFCRDAAV